MNQKRDKLLASGRGGGRSVCSRSTSSASAARNTACMPFSTPEAVTDAGSLVAGGEGPPAAVGGLGAAWAGGGLVLDPSRAESGAVEGMV